MDGSKFPKQIGMTGVNKAVDKYYGSKYEKQKLMSVIPF